MDNIEKFILENSMEAIRKLGYGIKHVGDYSFAFIKRDLDFNLGFWDTRIPRELVIEYDVVSIRDRTRQPQNNLNEVGILKTETTKAFFKNDAVNFIIPFKFIKKRYTVKDVATKVAIVNKLRFWGGSVYSNKRIERPVEFQKVDGGYEFVIDERDFLDQLMHNMPMFTKGIKDRMIKNEIFFNSGGSRFISKY